ncbi:MAG: PAS domain S-box protein [Desulfohalobiaceae bacterium]|nr:PAS domain S-box protein [Desulfohalobiaceae bacterium]
MDQLENRTREELIAELRTCRERVSELEGSRIQDTRRQTDQLHLYRQKFRTLIETTSSGYWELDADEVTVDVNQGLCSLLGYARQEILGKTPFEFVDKDNIRIFEKHAAKTAVELNRSYEITLRKGNGDLLYAHFDSTTLYDQENRISGSFAFVTDITDRVLIEKALRESEIHFRQLFEQAAIGIIVVDNAHNIVDVNQFVLDMLGYSKNEMLAFNAEDILHPDDSKDVPPDWTQSRVLQGEIVDIERRYRTKSGVYLPVRVSMRRMKGVLGKGSYMVMFQDISKYKQAEAEKEKLYQQLVQSQKIEALGTLTGGIAHDFNNILGIILGYTELAQNEAPEGTSGRAFLEEVKNACLRGRDIVSQLRIFTRKETEKRGVIDIGPVIKEGLKMLRSTIPASIEIKDSIPGDLPRVKVNPTQIHQVLVNLCTNAAHAMEATGGLLKVILKREILTESETIFDPEAPPGEYVRLTVSDTGQGIPDKDLKRIFDPYFTTKDLDRGSGLGLSVVQGIIKSHGGGIRVGSVLGQGTVFDIYLPVTAEDLVKQVPEITRKMPTGTERILFVDDEASMVDLNRNRLERLGYKVAGTTDPFQALEWFRNDPHGFDLIITDMTMPGMTGDRLTRDVLRIRPDIPVILCTGHSERVTRETAKDLGAAKYLQKPTDMNELAVSVRYVLDNP